MRFWVQLDDEAFPVEVEEIEGRYRLRIGEEQIEVDARFAPSGPCSLLIEGRSYLADVRPEADGAYRVDVGGEGHRVRVEEEARRALLGRQGPAGRGAQRLTAPMPGKVVAVAVAVGDAVNPGDPLVVLEAMKMENEFKAAVAGTVREVRVQPGQPVNAGDLLIVIE
ncbi:MAG: biotin/lipoyl-binding protein [Candidatus Rokubacteria bacterium]|nr:biotin/lipoyl-binding protein [Candidatus Rokubacteria bacterium]